VVNGPNTRFLYYGLKPIQEAGATGIVTLLNGFGTDAYLTRTDAAGTRTLLTDALGSTVAVADAAGVVQTQYTYEPFRTTAVTGLSDANEFQYTGRENDGTGLHYYRARYYHPGPQRFVSEDPIEFDGGGVNLYVYVANNPIVLIDPFGLKVNWGRYKVGNPELQRRLELLRAHLGRDIDVTGGDRTEEENEKVGGAKDSRHLIGGAVDFHVLGLSDCREAALAAESSLFHRVGYYPPNSPDPHMHVDLRKEGGHRGGDWKETRVVNGCSGVGTARRGHLAGGNADFLAEGEVRRVHEGLVSPRFDGHLG